MNELKELLSNPVHTIVTIALLLIVAEWIFSRITFLRGRFDAYYKNRTQKETFQQRVEKMDEITEKHTEALGQITDELKRLNNRLDEIEAQRDADFVVSARTSLYQLYEELKDRDSLTPFEYEAFDQLAQKYLKKKGNGVYKKIIIPTILSKPVVDAHSEDE